MKAAVGDCHGMACQESLIATIAQVNAQFFPKTGHPKQFMDEVDGRVGVNLYRYMLKLSQMDIWRPEMTVSSLLKKASQPHGIERFVDVREFQTPFSTGCQTPAR